MHLQPESEESQHSHLIGISFRYSWAYNRAKIPKLVGSNSDTTDFSSDLSTGFGQRKRSLQKEGRQWKYSDRIAAVVGLQLLLLQALVGRKGRYTSADRLLGQRE